MNPGHPAIVGHYKTLYMIGKGPFSMVYHGCDTRNDRVVALKFISRKDIADNYALGFVERELRISQRLSHKNVVKIYETIYTDEYIIIVMEYLRCGTITSLTRYSVNKLMDESYLRWGKDILEGLQYLHERNISHHDIKPDNIGFDDDMNAKIFDFGLCEECFLEKKNCKYSCGTGFFVAPEVVTEKEYDGSKADIWSFGITFHYMVTGELPFIKNITHDQFIDSCPDIMPLITSKCEGIMKTIVDRTLIQDPRKRPSAKELLQSGLFNGAERPVHLHRANSIAFRSSLQKTPKIANVVVNRRMSKPAIILPGKIKAIQPEKIIMNKYLA